MNVDTDLIEWIAEQYDPEFIVELLGISSKELLVAFYDDLLEQREKFELD
tara:strand:- start:1157 stop:1306 length:150 start_codon:yes stop_codon:yes gene_type:complete